MVKVVKTISRKKEFYVVAYDIFDNKRRSKVVKLLTKVGKRINMSVFECMLTPSELTKLKSGVKALIDYEEDTVVYYKICRRCYAKIDYMPPSREIKAGPIVVAT